jgi:NIMA (never in mitosis gene a)-related kinase
MAAPRRSGVATSSHINGYLDVSEMEKYKLVSNIGKGSFGVISKVQRVDDGRVSYGTRAWLMAGICS